MKKLALIAIAALTMLAACTKENDPAAAIDGSRWAYSYTESSGRKITCNLSLRENGGELTITDRYSSHYTEWNDYWRYYIKSYTYDGTNGTIELRSGSAYTEDGTATFRLNDIQSKMYLSTPKGSYTLDRM